MRDLAPMLPISASDSNLGVGRIRLEAKDREAHALASTINGVKGDQNWLWSID